MRWCARRRSRPFGPLASGLPRGPSCAPYSGIDLMSDHAVVVAPAGEELSMGAGRACRIVLGVSAASSLILAGAGSSLAESVSPATKTTSSIAAAATDWPVIDR